MKTGDRVTVTGRASLKGKNGTVDATSESLFGMKFVDVLIDGDDDYLRLRESDVKPLSAAGGRVPNTEGRWAHQRQIRDLLQTEVHVTDNEHAEIRPRTEAGRRYWDRER